MLLNKLSSRTYNDPNQYPIMPWLFLEEGVDKIRNFNIPISMQDEDQQQMFLAKKGNDNKEDELICHGNHYSASAYIYFYLMRAKPFTNNMIKFQNNTFDVPDRQYADIQQTLFLCQKVNNNREMIPELFSIPEIYINLNDNDFGKRKDGVRIHNITFAPYAQNVIQFCYLLKNLINNNIEIKQTAYISDNGFIHKFQKLIKEVVIPYQYSVLEDKAEGNVEKSHVIQNFINAGNVLAGKGQGDGFYGMVFQDSDAAKWIEAVGYSLAILPDPELESLADKFIDIIAAAQDTDGYLNTYFTIKDKEKRWTNLLEGHELYCAGHMLEAACAYYESTGKKTLLNVMIKNVEHIYSVFMNESDEMKFNGIPGHPEVELALMKL